ncbi:MAG: DoxX family protein [Limnochordaceae bacterium]|uniref:DoxX family protein n=1 Tax=Carboxydichorda subterranea TaxID=3109565 RepID=A0ABZ1C3D3_9FIRM|nr:DoxX family protein [Limnochorda sp. L945t]MBE3597620.1 DoxX family protein [Limnochordaceae bacterium]WRP18667.1 DoxX family protein [Limnochorda sp. L945t]
MDIVFLIGRIIYGGFFILNAFNHFRNVSSMAGYARSKGVAAPEAAVIGTGLMLLAGGLSVLLGYLPTVGLGLIVIFLVVVAFWMHSYWAVPDPMARMGEQTNFFKNLALAGAALMMTLLPQPWPLSLGG